MFNPVRSEKIYQQVNRQVQELILSGELKKGDKLPGERQLAEMLNVSRASVRESLRSLKSWDCWKVAPVKEICQ